MGKLLDIMLGKPTLFKYGDTGNPIITIKINAVGIPHVLVDLGADINSITSTTVISLGL